MSARFKSSLYAASAVLASAALLLPATVAQASVTPRSATVETGDLSQFDQTNAQAGTVAATSSMAYDGSHAADATYTGGGTNAFERGIFNVNWNEGDDVDYGMAVYLPTGFKSAMQGEVDLMRWDNWDVDPTNTDRCGVVIFGSDKRGHFQCWQLGVNGSTRAVLPSFDIPEGRWVWIEVHQHLSSTAGQGVSEVWIDGQLAGRSTDANSFGRPVTRLRYGLVATAGTTQTNPLTLYFDRATISSSYIGPLSGSAPPPPPPPPNQAPSVALTSPLAGDTFSRSLSMTASAQDDSAVSRVDFLMDGVKVGSDSSAPYSTSYRPSKSLPYGAHTLTAVAYDAAGLSASSAPVSVTRVH